MALYDSNIEIWAGSGSFYPLTFTPFGFYDNDPEFQCDAEATAKWCAIRLGFPIVNVELQEVNFYAAFEEAVNEYGAQLNTYQARDNLLVLQGAPTGSTNLAQKYVPQTLKGIFKIAKSYGTEAGSGGYLKYYSGSLNLIQGKQVYDLLSDVTIESGSFATDEFTIRKIFHEPKPASTRFLDPALGNSFQVLGEFGWSGMAIPGSYLLMPMYFDLLRMQAIEFNDTFRKSGYSFQITGNRLRIFPIPSQDTVLWFHYSLDGEDGNGGTSGKITDISNIPYHNITYRYINELGKQWIRRYALAIVKEMLGHVRSKYASLPIPDAETTMNGADLLSQAQTEKEGLITELKEILDSMSMQAQMERKTAVANSLSEQLAFIPVKIYVK